MPPDIVTRGIFSVWKPPGISSSKATLQLRTILHGGHTYFKCDEAGETLRRNRGDFTSNRGKRWIKVGHGGTLDVFSEGVLVIGVGRDCRRLQGYLTDTDKQYRVRGELGKMTDTLDPLGVVVQEASWDHIRQEKLKQTLNEFLGEISQIPPSFSAKKFKGRRLSDIAIEARDKEAAVSVSPKAIKVTLRSIELLNFDPPWFTLSVVCSSGTYMRSLVRDIGMRLGSVAHVTALERLKQGQFTKENALRQEDWNVENIRSLIRSYGFGI